MKARFYTSVVTAVCALSIAIGSGAALQAAVSPLATKYEPISAEQMKAQATAIFNNAKEAGRLQAEDIRTLETRLAAASSLPEVEQVWADIEAKAQIAKSRHTSLDSLLQEFQNRLSMLQRRGISPESDGWKFYTDRLAGIRRIQKQLTANSKVWLFWDFTALAVDLSSVSERLTRAVESRDPELESFDDLILRTDNYIARNEVVARGLTTYKSFEVEPGDLQSARQTLYSVLVDRAHSRLQTPEVKAQLVQRLRSAHYEAARGLPTEKDIDTAIVEVQRLIDAGAKNGHLSAKDNVRIQHELELVKQLKRAYPGPNPGIDPIERELRMEEVRFMSLDLRFLQDWLGRLLRADGETQESREQVLRLLRRTDLAYFSHRITHKDALDMVSAINVAIRDSKNETELFNRVKALHGKLDMQISDFSMVPANTVLRHNQISDDLTKLRIDRDSAMRDFEHASQLTQTVTRMPEGAPKYGSSIVAATELEMVRSSVAPLLQLQNRQR
jgi:hypothetical protein